MAKNRYERYSEELANCVTNEEVRTLYIQAIQERGGVSEELDKVFKAKYTKTRNVHKNAQGKVYNKQTILDYKTFSKLVNKILGLQKKGVKLNLRTQYAWIIITGDTKAVSKELKAMGLWYDFKIQQWHYNFKFVPKVG